MVPGARELTPRQVEALTLHAKGFMSKEAAREMGIAPNTVEVFILQAKERLGAKSVTHAVAIALHLGLIQFDPDSIGEPR